MIEMTILSVSPSPLQTYGLCYHTQSSIEEQACFTQPAIKYILICDDISKSSRVFADESSKRNPLNKVHLCFKVGLLQKHPTDNNKEDKLKEKFPSHCGGLQKHAVNSIYKTWSRFLQKRNSLHFYWVRSHSHSCEFNTLKKNNKLLINYSDVL